MGSGNVEGINVPITASLDGLRSAFSEAAGEVQFGVRAIEQNINKVNQATAKGGDGFTGLTKKIEKFSTSSVFALAAFASGGKLSIDGVLNSVNAIAFALGPEKGAIALAITATAKTLVDVMTKTRDELRRTAEEFEKSLTQMINAGAKEGIYKKALEIWIGTPAQIASGQRGLQQLAKDLADAKAVIARGEVAGTRTGFAADATGGKTVLQRAKDQVAELEPLVTQLQGQFDALMKAMNAPMPGTMGTLEAMKNVMLEFREPMKPSAMPGPAAPTTWMRSISKSLVLTSKEAGAAMARDAQNASDATESVVKKAWDNIGVHAQIVADQIRETQHRIMSEWLVVFQPFEQAVARFIQQGGNLRDFWRSLWYGMLQEYSGFLMRKGQLELAAELREHDLTVGGSAKRLGVWAAENVKKGAMYAADGALFIATELAKTAAAIASGIKRIAVAAAEAAAKAWAAIAGIPVVGPVLAPAVAVATLAGVLALANNIGGGGGGGGASAPAAPSAPREARAREGGGAATNITIYAMDGADVHRVLTRHPAAVAAGVAGAVKNGALTSKKMGLSG